MKRSLILAFLLAPARASAQQTGQLGAGVVVGNPTGMTLKYWLDRTRAIDFGVGFSGDAALYADFLWHAWDVFPKPAQGKLSFYAGLGPRLETKPDAVFGIRSLLGLSYWLPRHPVEVFLDGGPVFELTPDRDVSADIGLGIRFYLGARR